MARAEDVDPEVGRRQPSKAVAPSHTTTSGSRPGGRPPPAAVREPRDAGRQPAEALARGEPARPQRTPAGDGGQRVGGEEDADHAGRARPVVGEEEPGEGPEERGRRPGGRGRPDRRCARSHPLDQGDDGTNGLMARITSPSSEATAAGARPPDHEHRDRRHVRPRRSRGRRPRPGHVRTRSVRPTSCPSSAQRLTTGASASPCVGLRPPRRRARGGPGSSCPARADGGAQDGERARGSRAARTGPAATRRRRCARAPRAWAGHRTCGAAREHRSAPRALDRGSGRRRRRCATMENPPRQEPQPVLEDEGPHHDRGDPPGHPGRRRRHLPARRRRRTRASSRSSSSGPA